MSYEARKKSIENIKADVDYIMSFFPKDYSDRTLSTIRINIESRVTSRVSDYKDAFCQDNNLCPICISGGWDCSSDHK